jgi:hypothetical protein
MEVDSLFALENRIRSHTWNFKASSGKGDILYVKETENLSCRQFCNGSSLFLLKNFPDGGNGSG